MRALSYEQLAAYYSKAFAGNDIVNIEGLNQAKELRELVLDRNKIKVSKVMLYGHTTKSFLYLVFRNL